VTARVGHPFVKRYAEERELTLLMMSDLSGSLRFGTGPTVKRVAIAELAAVLAFAAVVHNDRVGLLGFTDQVERYVRPEKGPQHALRVLRDVLYFEPQRTRTDLAVALDHLNRVHRKRAIVFLFSDFLTPGFEDGFRRAARRHDLIAVRISDPLERAWPDAGLVQLQDAETGQQVLIDAGSSKFRTAFAERAEARTAAFTRLARSAQVDLIDASTDGKHFDELLKFFRLRDRRRRSG